MLSVIGVGRKRKFYPPLADAAFASGKIAA
jgi:hypothetical protein